MDTTNLVEALAESMNATEAGDRSNRPRLMAEELLASLHFRAWLAQRLEETVFDAEIHDFHEQADDLCGGPLPVRIARNGAQIA